MGDEKKILDPEHAAALERLEAARAKLAARRAAAEPDIEKRQALDDAALAEAQLEHGEDAIGVAETRLGRVIVRKPTAREATSFSDRIGRLKKGDEGGMRDAAKALVMQCRIHPSADRLVEIAADQPFAIAALATLCARLGGAVEGE